MSPDTINQVLGIVLVFNTFTRQDELVLVLNTRKRIPLFKFPGGRVKAGEDSHSAVIREIYEETRIPVSTGEKECVHVGRIPDVVSKRTNLTYALDLFLFRVPEDFVDTPVPWNGSVCYEPHLEVRRISLSELRHQNTFLNVHRGYVHRLDARLEKSLFGSR
jgi:8-oxo-dGTP pyrophosphatase MutT (NUDIX family)